MLLSTEAQICRYNQVSLGTSTELESKSSDLDVFEPGWSTTVTFPKSYDWDASHVPKVLRFRLQQIRYVVPENLCFGT